MDRSSCVSDDYMRRAIQLSIESIQAGGGPFGAVIVNDSGIVAEGSNQVTLSNDPTAHAEIVAVRNACQALGRFHLSDCVLYSSCEPCPMCLAACYWARIPSLYYGNTREDAARIGFSDQFIFQEIAKNTTDRQITTKQVLHTESFEAFRRWNAKLDKVPY